MGSEWKKTSVGKYAKLQGGFAFKSKDFVEEGIPVAKIKNVKAGEIDLTDCAFVSADSNGSYSEFFVKSGDVLISMTGSGLNAPNSIVGRVAKHNGLDNTFLINQRVGRFKIKDKSKIDNSFLYYYLRPREKQLEFVSIATGSANQVNISGKQIESFEINLPPLQEQKAIAHILGSLDDKIELNRKMNETLEEMAQALFKSWFVDFDPVLDKALAAGHKIPEPLQAKAEKRKALGNKRKALPQAIADLFPDRFVFTEELGWEPEGWKVKKISDLADVIGGGTPSIKKEEYWVENGIPWLSPKDLSGYQWKFISRGAKDISQEGLQKSSARILPEGSILFSSRAPIGYLAISENEVSTNQGFKSLVPTKEVYKDFLFYFMKSNVGFIESISSGSTFKEVSGMNIKELDVIKAKDEVFESFSKILEPTNERLLQVQKETNKLTTIRDILLPKLISGDLRVTHSC